MTWQAAQYCIDHYNLFNCATNITFDSLSHQADQLYMNSKCDMYNIAIQGDKVNITHLYIH